MIKRYPLVAASLLSLHWYTCAIYTFTQEFDTFCEDDWNCLLRLKSA